MVGDALFIDLYKEGKLQHIEINQKFISILPGCTKNIIDFNTMMEQALENAVKRFRNEYKNLSGKTVEELEVQELRLFLIGYLWLYKKIYYGFCRNKSAYLGGERKIFCVYGKNSSLIRNRYV